MKTVLLTRPVVRILIAAGCVLGLVLVVWLMSGMPAPSENNRVGPTGGSFSIIKPPDWNSDILYAPVDRRYSTIVNMTPKKSVGREQKFFVGQLRDSAIADGFKQQMEPFQFQGRPAWVFSQMRKHDYFYQVLFSRDARWYEMSVSLPVEENIPHSDWWPYLMSFKAVDVPATTAPIDATTPPATARSPGS